VNRLDNISGTLLNDEFEEGRVNKKLIVLVVLLLFGAACEGNLPSDVSTFAAPPAFSFDSSTDSVPPPDWHSAPLGLSKTLVLVANGSQGFAGTANTTVTDGTVAETEASLQVWSARQSWSLPTYTAAHRESGRGYRAASVHFDFMPSPLCGHSAYVGSRHTGKRIYAWNIPGIGSGETVTASETVSDSKQVSTPACPQMEVEEPIWESGEGCGDAEYCNPPPGSGYPPYPGGGSGGGGGICVLWEIIGYESGDGGYTWWEIYRYYVWICDS
jgi:hypothetical protein